ncbi:hypothetical protein BofuT4_P053110.1 [Botrytis cinerea T4]|uniref:Uncharacterized protein n=1 Tax=Botryotinia fuckeliana (strain T4) TaxID=999810 RepID=G2XV90_BOTF4|nr:hypothetical protein BofuT4_P053110.1 [Botrytis cinerea T4]
MWSLFLVSEVKNDMKKSCKICRFLASPLPARIRVLFILPELPNPLTITLIRMVVASTLDHSQPPGAPNPK